MLPHRPHRSAASPAAWRDRASCRAFCRAVGGGVGVAALLAAAGCSTLPGSSSPPLPLQAPQSAELPPSQPTLVQRLLWPGRGEWRGWGREHLQNGDVVFVRSNYYLMLGTFNLSRFLAEVGQSPFSHVGLVVVEPGGEPLVYDITDRGIHSQPFAKFVTSGSIELVAVRRPIGEARRAIDAAVQYVRDQQQAGTPFDRRFQPGDDSLYCTELIVEAYRQGGIELAPATAAGSLPGIADVSPTTLRLVQWGTRLEADDPVVLPGNPHSGLYGSPWLRTILEPTEL